MTTDRCRTLQELEQDGAFIQRRRLLIGAFIMRQFLYGVEYTIILPSVWLYLKHLNASVIFFGCVLAVNPFGTLLTVPLFGRFYDVTRRMRCLVFTLNACAIAGNLIYSFDFSKWCPFVGRFISGIGLGFYALSVSEIGHVFQSRDRTGVLVLLGIGENLGWILGPVINFAIAKVDIKLTCGWQLNFMTCPGLIMAALWCCMQIVTFFCVTDLASYVRTCAHASPRDDVMLVRLVSVHQDDVNTKLCVENGTLVSVADGTLTNITAGNITNGRAANGHVLEHNFHSNADSVAMPTLLTSPKLPVRTVLKSLLAVEFAVLVLVDFTLRFAQASLQVFLPLIPEKEYGWSQLKVAAIYLAGGVEVLVVFAVLYAIGKRMRVRDVNLALGSLALTILALLLVIMETNAETERRPYVLIVTAVVAFCAVPLTMIAVKAQVSKMAPSKGLGLVQGFFESTSRVSVIAGLLLGSVAFDDRQSFGVVMTAIVVIVIICLLLCRRRILRRQLEKEADECVDEIEL